MNEFEHCIDALCTSITAQAVCDWILLKRVSDGKRKLPKYFDDNLESLEEFFNSGYGEDITHLNGKFLLKKLNEFYERTGGKYGTFFN